MSITGTDLLSVQLLVNGKTSNAPIIRIEVEKGINKITKATVVLSDGNKAKEDFAFSDSSDFNPGNKIEIKAGYHSKEKTIFKGVILSQKISVDVDKEPSLQIECKNEVLKTAKDLKNNYFNAKTDAEIINKILSTYNLIKSVESTSYKHEEVIQYATTDWDFIRYRANLNGLVVVTNDEKINVSKPDVSSSPVYSLIYGENIIKLDLTLTSENQLQSVEVVSWDASNQNIITGKSNEPSINKQGSLTGKNLAEVSNNKALIQTSVPLEKEVLNSFANAQLLKSRLSRFQGTIQCEGNADIKPNTLVELKGIGDKYNGNAFVSNVFHELSNGIWLTVITIGLNTIKTSINSINTSKRIPAISGLQIGIVKKIDNDPSGAFRVLVNLPIIKDKDKGVWARLGNFSASKGFGSFFYPEVEDEVILGFLDGNPSAPIILGSLYSKKRKPVLAPDDINSHKSITSSSGLTIDFNEVDKTVIIKTPSYNSITLSDKDKGITLKDQNDNSVQLNETGITLESKKDIVIKAANKISITAENIALEAANNVDVSANNIMDKANITYSAQAGANAELKASGEVSVKGAMVNIN